MGVGAERAAELSLVIRLRSGLAQAGGRGPSTNPRRAAQVEVAVERHTEPQEGLGCQAAGGGAVRPTGSGRL